MVIALAASGVQATPTFTSLYAVGTPTAPTPSGGEHYDANFVGRGGELAGTLHSWYHAPLPYAWAAGASSGVPLHAPSNFGLAYFTDGHQRVGEQNAKAAMWMSSPNPTTVIELDALTYPYSLNSRANRCATRPSVSSVTVRAVGRVYTFTSYAPEYHAWVWDVDTYGNIQAFDLTNAVGGPIDAEALGTDGESVVGVVTASNGEPHAYLWAYSPGTNTWTHGDLHPSGISDPPSFSYAVSIRGGQVVGSVGWTYGTAGERAAILTPGSYRDLHPAGYSSSRANDTNGTYHVGQVASGQTYAAMWDNSGTRTDLHALMTGTGWTGSRADSIVTDSNNVTKVYGLAWKTNATTNVTTYHVVQWQL